MILMPDLTSFYRSVSYYNQSNQMHPEPQFFSSSPHHYPAQAPPPLIPSPKSAKVAAVFECVLCQISCSDNRALEAHFEGSKHKKKMTNSAKPTGSFQCTLCQVTCVAQEQLKAHEAGKAHLKMLQRRRDATSNTFTFSEDGSPKVNVLASPKMSFVRSGFLDSVAEGAVAIEDKDEMVVDASSNASHMLTKQATKNEQHDRAQLIRCDLCECKFYENLLDQHLASKGHLQAMHQKYPESSAQPTDDIDDDTMSIASEQSIFENDTLCGSSNQKLLKFQDQSGEFNRFLPKFSVPVGYSPITEKMTKPFAKPTATFKVPEAVPSTSISGKIGHCFMQDATIIRKPTPTNHEVSGNIPEQEQKDFKITSVNVTDGHSNEPMSSAARPQPVQNAPQHVGEQVREPSQSQVQVVNAIDSNLFNQSFTRVFTEMRALARTVVQTTVPDKTCILSASDMFLLKQLQTIMASNEEIKILMEIVENVERSLLLAIHDLRINRNTLEIVDKSEIAPEFAESYDSLYLELRRVSSLGLNLILKEAEDFQFVLVLKYKPNTELFSKLTAKLNSILASTYPDDDYTVLGMQESQSITTFPIKFLRTFEIRLTCPAFDRSIPFNLPIG
jgi:hypothetical protein